MGTINKKNIMIENRSEQWVAQEIYNKWNKKRLDVPDFQREDIWDNPRKSRLIESMIRGIPIPPIYILEKEDKFLVVDGQQRIRSIVDYIDEKFKLSGLEMLKDELTNYKYSNLKGKQEFANKFHEVKIPVVIIKTDDKEIVYEIFDRLNTGGMQLNAQEIRNCIYHGTYNDMIKEIAKSNENFKSIFGKSYKKQHDRMQDAELVLRFFAFSRYSINNLDNCKSSPLKRFLNKEMEDHQNLKEDELNELKNLFENTIKLAREIFGDKAFRMFNVGTSDDKNAKWDDKISRGLFDCVIWGLSKYAEKREEKNCIVKCKDTIYEELLNLMTFDKMFIDAVKNRNHDQDQVEYRFSKWLNSINEITKLPNNSFSLRVKNEIYNKDNKCGVCGGRIEDINDAVIDIKNNEKPYWKGGVIPMYANMQHRYCAKSKDEKQQ